MHMKKGASKENSHLQQRICDSFMYEKAQGWRVFGVLSVNSKLASFHKQRMEQFRRIFSFDVI